MSADRRTSMLASETFAIHQSRPGLDTWLHAANTALVFALVLVAIIGVPVPVQTGMLALGAVTVAALLRIAAIRTPEPRMRASWNWFAAMLFLLGLYWTDIAITGERMVMLFVDFDEISRYFLATAYISCMVALWYCVRAPRRLLARLFLDTGIVLAGVIVLVGIALTHTTLDVSGRELTNQLIYVWLVDLAALSLALLALATSERGAPRSAQFVYVSISLTVVCIGHAGSALASLQMSESRPAWVYLCLGFSGWLMGVMAYRYIQGIKTGAAYRTVVLTTPTPVTQNIWFHIGHAIVPYSIAMCAAVLLFVMALDENILSVSRRSAFIGASAFVLVAGWRHVISYIENRELYVNLNDMNRDLEVLVDDRTRELSRRNHELEALHQVALVSAASLDQTRILQAVAEQLSRAVGASHCLIFKKSIGDGSLHLLSEFHAEGDLDTGHVRADTEVLSSARGAVFEPAGLRTALIEQLWLEPDSRAACLLDHYSSATAMIVPLVAGEQTIGEAEIYRTHPEPFDEHEVSLAEAITTQGALAAENAHAYDTARIAASHDPVTGLLNHRALHDELTRLFERAVRRSTRLSVLMMDLNLFKEFNDRYGHQAGDRVLADIGQAIKQSMPTAAVVARYGGDEFTVGVVDVSDEMLQMVVTTIREHVDAVQQKHGYVGEGFGVAIGIASYPDDAETLAEIVARADEAMYEDKWRLKGFLERRRDQPEAREALISPVL